MKLTYVRGRSPRLIAGLSALIVATLFGATACGSSSGSSAVAAGAKGGSTITVGFIANTHTPSGPEGWANNTGILVPGLKSAGISGVKWISFKNGPDLSAAMQGGSIDIATLGDTPGLTAKANGLPTELVNQSSVGQDAEIFVKKGGPTSIDALKGQTIATQVGSYYYRYLVSLLQEKGIYNTVKITNVYTTAALAALQSGGIAAYVAPSGQLTDAMHKAGFTSIDKESNHPDLLGSSVTVITDKALKAHPDLPAAWNAVRSKSIADMAAHPDAYYAYAAKAGQTTAAVIKDSVPISHYPSAPFTDQGMALLQGCDTFLADNKLSKGLVDLDAWKVPNPQS